jgi:Holliday junction resolvase RusA-like endonuclease
VRIDFRLAAARNANESWDLDNLIKPTLDAMEGVFGPRLWRGTPQPADDQVDRLETSKRLPAPAKRLARRLTHGSSVHVD